MAIHSRLKNFAGNKPRSCRGRPCPARYQLLHYLQPDQMDGMRISSDKIRAPNDGLLMKTARTETVVTRIATCPCTQVTLGATRWRNAPMTPLRLGQTRWLQ